MYVTKYIDSDTKYIISTGASFTGLGLRTHITWRSNQDFRPYLSFQVSTKNSYKEIIYIKYDKKDGFIISSGILRDIKNFFKRLIHFRDVRRIIKQIMSLHDQCYSISTDPMCGCPEDFIESFSKKIAYLQKELYRKYY
jgi:hypothetical protein